MSRTPLETIRKRTSLKTGILQPSAKIMPLGTEELVLPAWSSESQDWKRYNVSFPLPQPISYIDNSSSCRGRMHTPSASYKGTVEKLTKPSRVFKFIIAPKGQCRFPGIWVYIQLNLYKPRYGLGPNASKDFKKKKINRTCTNAWRLPWHIVLHFRRLCKKTENEEASEHVSKHILGMTYNMQPNPQWMEEKIHWSRRFTRACNKISGKWTDFNHNQILGLRSKTRLIKLMQLVSRLWCIYAECAFGPDAFWHVRLNPEFKDSSL